MLKNNDAKSGGHSQADYVKHMDSAMARVRLNQDTTLYRGVGSYYVLKSFAEPKFVKAQTSGVIGDVSKLDEWSFYIPYSFQETSLNQRYIHMDHLELGRKNLY